jgi:predicted transposase/invertase (TIGR01784 family)
MNSKLRENQKKYDAMAKELLSRKQVIANILKYAVREFKDYSVQEIISFLSGEPEVGEDEVDDNIPSKLDVAGRESNSINDGVRTFDIKFRVKVPNSNEEAELIINIEAQGNSNPGYTLEKRGIYYLSRLISSQYNVDFVNSDFDKLKKCYSIWICNKSSKEYQNTIAEYSFKQTKIVGNPPDKKSRYDLVSLIMINLGATDNNTDENYKGLIKMLDCLLNKISSGETSEILKSEFDITIENGGFDDMCNLSTGIYNDGRREGISIGEKRGISIGEKRGLSKGKAETMLEIIKNKMKYKNMSLDEALEDLFITQEQYLEYIKIVNEES